MKFLKQNMSQQILLLKTFELFDQSWKPQHHIPNMHINVERVIKTCFFLPYYRVISSRNWDKKCCNLISFYQILCSLQLTYKRKVFFMKPKKDKEAVFEKDYNLLKLFTVWIEGN